MPTLLVYVEAYLLHVFGLCLTSMGPDACGTILCAYCLQCEAVSSLEDKFCGYGKPDLF